jgi:hypothetical protein
VLPAIEAPAQQGPPLINCASRRPQIHTRATRGCGQQKNGVACLVSGNLMPVRFDIVPLLRMEKEPLVTSAAFCTVAARYIGLFAGWQNPILRETASGNDSSQMHGHKVRKYILTPNRPESSSTYEFHPPWLGSIPPTHAVLCWSRGNGLHRPTSR